ncbi:MAG: transposase [Chloroflexota bacterium]|nr:transposase [Chloroflexota bacterium]
MYPPAFKAEAVQLARSSNKSLGAVAKDLGIADRTLRNWVRQAEVDGGERDGRTQGEREALRHLRREVRTLRQEREILRGCLERHDRARRAVIRRIIPR